MTAIDTHAHWTPEGVARALRRREAVPRIVGPTDDETYHSIYGDRPFGRLETDLGARIKFMDTHGIETQVLSLPGLFGIDTLPPDEALPLVGMFNDESADACREWPGRFLALAALPLADIEASCRELRRADRLGLRGAILPADGFLSLDTARTFEPLLALAADLGSHLFIHPGPLTRPVAPGKRSGSDSAWLRHIVLATQARLSEAMITLNLSGLLDPWPHLTIQVANLGGALPFYAERIDQVSRVQLRDAQPIEPRLRRCFADTSSFGPRAIELAVRCFGADRVLFGTDCPIFDTADMVDAVSAARISGEERDLILRGNARALFARTTDEFHPPREAIA